MVTIAPSRTRSASRLIALCLLPLLLGGCYYPHIVGGQIKLLMAREPIDRLVERPQTDAALKQRLLRVVEARRWAVSALALPDNGSYTDYAALDRPYVVWNVFATTEFSLDPVEQCFLFVGCLAYQGFYTQDKAEARAAELRGRGLDVSVGGVPAYSTLGWFDDPVISTMMHWDDATLIGTVFHELAHQQLFVRNDTLFNESYASFVEEQGLQAYLAAYPQIAPPDPLARGRRTQFVQLLLAARQRLADVYALSLDADEMRVRKEAEFMRLQRDYRRLRDTAWNGDARYDAWFADTTPNNARLLPYGLYDEYVPAFAALFDRVERDWPRFHAEVKRLSMLDAEARKAELDSLLLRRRPE